jgi:hypothetical protein
MADRDGLKEQRRELVKSLIAEADRKLEGGYTEFSADFAGAYTRLGPRLGSLDASVTLRAVSCMEPEQARAYVEQKQPLKVNGASVEVAYLEIALNAVSYMTPEQTREFVAAHPSDLEVISDEDYAFRKGAYKPSLGDDSSVELAYPELLIVAMRHKDLSLDVRREWIRNGLSLPGHSLNVSEDMLIIASEYLGFGKREAAKYELFGLLHDLGKLEVDPEYLGSGKQLDDAGWASMKQHPSKGQEIIKSLSRYARTEYSRRILAEAAEATRWHHENFDGSGYPDKISGDNIPLAARILRIADFWSARTAHRSYSSSMPVELAVEEGKRCSGQPHNERVLREYQEKVDPRYTRWQRGPEMEFDPEICRRGEVFEVLAKAPRRVA